MCVGVGVTWSGLCYGLKEPGDSRALRDPHSGNKSPRPPASVRCKCVFPFFSFSVPSTSQFHLCYFHPLSFQFNLHPPPSTPPPSLCSTERAADPLGGQINSPVRAAQSAAGSGCGTETTFPATLSHIIHNMHTHAQTHTPAFTC